MRKRADIIVGDQVNYIVKFDPELSFNALVPAKVVDLWDDSAQIEIRYPENAFAQPLTRVVKTSELENKRWDIDFKIHTELMHQRWEDAEKVEAKKYDGWVYEALTEKYFQSLSDYLERNVGYEEYYFLDKKEYVFCAILAEPYEPIVEDWVCDNYEDYFPEGDYEYEVEGIEDLEIAFEKFHNLNKAAMSYPVVDYTRAIVLNDTAILVAFD